MTDPFPHGLHHPMAVSMPSALSLSTVAYSLASIKTEHPDDSVPAHAEDVDVCQKVVVGVEDVAVDGADDGPGATTASTTATGAAQQHPYVSTLLRSPPSPYTDALNVKDIVSR